MTPMDIVLRPLEPARAAEKLELQLRNREYWRGSGPRLDDEWFTVARQRMALEAQAVDRAEGRHLSFGVHLGTELVGRLALSNIIRGPFLNASLGYAIDERHAGRGIATAAVAQAVAIAWEEGLHRVQAAVSPGNAASKRVVEKVGFRHEGLALRYLRLDGVWSDQELWAITVEDELRAPSFV
jgi:ribosomal-protein-alanine N-acetyltransferase